MFFIYNINTLCFRTIDNEKSKGDKTKCDKLSYSA